MSHIIAGDKKVRVLEKSSTHFFNRNAILFGATDSGKSTVLKEMLYLLKELVPLIFVFSLTAGETNTFDGIVPPNLIFKEIDIGIIERIYTRQKGATKIYNTVNDINALKELFLRVADANACMRVKVACKNAEIIIKKKRSNNSLDLSIKKSDITEIVEMRDEYLVKLYKHEIRIHKKNLKRMGISSKERYILKYLDFNPHCTIVFDDCGAVLKKFQNEEVIKKIMYQGRHNKINAFFTLQDDTDMASFIKKQSKVNIFTTDQCASAYFNRKSNSFPKQVKTKADDIIGSIFADGDNKKNYKKLIYLRGEPDPFRVVIADKYSNFRLGCPSLWIFYDKSDVDKCNNMSFEEDPLLAPFTVDI
jgi:hypothetical protein